MFGNSSGKLVDVPLGMGRTVLHVLIDTTVVTTVSSDSKVNAVYYHQSNTLFGTFNMIDCSVLSDFYVMTVLFWSTL